MKMNRVEYLLLIALIVCPSILFAGWFLVTQAQAGNTVALVIIVVIGVLLVNIVTNLSTLAAIFANQRQDNQVLRNSRVAQQEALEAARLLTQMQKAESERQKRSRQPKLPEVTVVEPEQLYLESENNIIEGLLDE